MGKAFSLTKEWFSRKISEVYPIQTALLQKNRTRLSRSSGAHSGCSHLAPCIAPCCGALVSELKKKIGEKEKMWVSMETTVLLKI